LWDEINDIALGDEAGDGITFQHNIRELTSAILGDDASKKHYLKYLPKL
jgi:hypothetical protein